MSLLAGQPIPFSFEDQHALTTAFRTPSTPGWRKTDTHSIKTLDEAAWKRVYNSSSALASLETIAELGPVNPDESLTKAQQLKKEKMWIERALEGTRGDFAFLKDHFGINIVLALRGSSKYELEAGFHGHPACTDAFNYGLSHSPPETDVFPGVGRF